MALQVLEPGKEPLAMLTLESFRFLQRRLLTVAIKVQVQFTVKHWGWTLEPK